MSALTAIDGMHGGWLQTPVGQLFACYHPPAPGSPARRAAVLMCHTFGSERMTLHLAHRALALRLSSEGFAVLRVDYAGTGDASGQPRASKGVEDWLAALDAAADWLLASSGAAELGVFGALLGGTLGLELAARRRDVTGAALWGPYPGGRAFVREMRAFQAMTRANPDRRKPDGFGEGDQEAIGFLLTAAQIASLRELDPRPPLGGLRQVALFARSRDWPTREWTDRLEAAGLQVTSAPRPVIDIAELVDEHARPPAALIDQLGDWWSTAYAPASGGEPSAVSGGELATRIRLVDPDHTEVVEELVDVGEPPSMRAIVTRPPRWAGGPAVVLVNGGANHRPGINRNYTEWARAWAGHGVLVVRMDIRGLGDSPPRRPEELSGLYLDHTRDDVVAAVDFVHRRYDATAVACGGVCAGAYQSFHAALVEPRIGFLFMLNPLRFQRDSTPPGRRPEIDHPHLGHYVGAVADGESWRRLLRGDVPIAEVSASVARRLALRAGHGARSIAAHAFGHEPPPATRLSGALRQLTGRGCRVLVVFDSAEPVRGRFEEELSLDRPRMEAQGRLRVEVLEQADHIFTPLWSQQALSTILGEQLVPWADQARPRAAS